MTQITQKSTKNKIDKAAGAAALFDLVKSKKKLNSDKELADLLLVDAPKVSKIRSNREPLGATLILRIHEEADISIKEIKGFIFQDIKH